jgi:hypothetical protein
VVERARIVLLAAAGKQNKEAPQNWASPRTKRALAQSLSGRRDHKVWRRMHPGRTSSIPANTVQRVIQMTTQEKPVNATHWSTRSLAAAVGLSQATVRRIWHKQGLKPHWVETFKVSTDPRFAEKLEAIVGLYLNPPEHALVLCCDEKSQIQALHRTPPSLPLKPGRAGTLTHDLTPGHGNSVRSAEHAGRQSHQPLPGAPPAPEWLRFLRWLDDATPAHKQLHLLVDIYATHKHPQVQRWLKRHPRFQVHFTPHQCFVAEHGRTLLS